MIAPDDYLFPMDFNAASVKPTALSGGERKPSAKQAKVLAYVRQHGQITLQKGVDLIGTDIYANAVKHVGVTLANMVRRGMLARVTKGVFCLPNGKDEQR